MKDEDCGLWAAALVGRWTDRGPLVGLGASAFALLGRSGSGFGWRVKDRREPRGLGLLCIPDRGPVAMAHCRSIADVGQGPLACGSRDGCLDLAGRPSPERKDFDMTFLELLILLLVAGISGAIGQALAGYSRGGCLGSVAVGFIGALLGTWIARTLGFSEILTINVNGGSFPIIWSIIGAALFVAFLGLITRGRP